MSPFCSKNLAEAETKGNKIITKNKDILFAALFCKCYTSEPSEHAAQGGSGRIRLLYQEVKHETKENMRRPPAEVNNHT